MCWFSPKKIEDNILYISTQLKQKGFDYLFLQILFLKVQMCRFINFFLSYLSLFFAKFEENIINIMGTTCTKLLKPTPYSCYELGHTWNPSCTGSSVEVGLTCLEEAVKIYSSVYFVSYKKIIIV